MSNQRKQLNRHFSLNTTIWFPGSAWEPNELQALPGLCG